MTEHERPHHAAEKSRHQACHICFAHADSSSKMFQSGSKLASSRGTRCVLFQYLWPRYKTTTVGMRRYSVTKSNQENTGAWKTAMLAPNKTIRNNTSASHGP